MSRSRAPPRSIVLIGLMGAGKTTIGRKLASRLGVAFRDADFEIERAAGCSISDMWALWGEPAFREGERRVISRLLQEGPIVLATGGGAFMDDATRATIREHATSIWLRCTIDTLVRRVSGRSHRPLLVGGDPRATLAELMRIRHPVYAEADIVVACNEDSADKTTRSVLASIGAHRPPEHVAVRTTDRSHDILIGPGLLARAGAILVPRLPQKRVVIVTDETVAALHLASLRAGLDAVGIAHGLVVVPPGEASRSLDGLARLTAALLETGVETGVERRHTVIALGGGVIGGLAGLASACVSRGLPWVHVPTTLLAQLGSVAGGGTGIGAQAGREAGGAPYQPLAVLADTLVLASLPARELRRGHAELLSFAQASDRGLFEWCLANGAAIVSGETSFQAEAVARTCRLKAQEADCDGCIAQPFTQALEAELGEGARRLRGEAVAIGLVLTMRLSALFGYGKPGDADRLAAHLRSIGMAADLAELGAGASQPLSARSMLAHMGGGTTRQDGQLSLMLSRGIGAGFVSRDVPIEIVRDLLVSQGCVPLEHALEHALEHPLGHALEPCIDLSARRVP